MIPLITPNFEEGIIQLNESVKAKKCWCCGCFQDSLDPIEKAFSSDSAPEELFQVIASARSTLTEKKYDCIGCEICHPAVALNALQVEFDACAAAPVEKRKGWPPFPGDYTVLRYQASVAVCTLTDDKLAGALVDSAPEELSIVGTLQTENLGIERLIANIVSNPFIHTLVVCGADSEQTVGHLPGQSLVALAEFGVDDQMRIINARGKRPRLKNSTKEIVKHFRDNISVVDLIGVVDESDIAKEVGKSVSKSPEPGNPFHLEKNAERVEGYLPEKMVEDPAGYFVVYPDRTRGLLSLEHYSNSGVISVVIEANTAAEVYTTAIDKGLVTRLDHAAYLGCELARAEESLKTGQVYVQDRAPERPKPAADS